MGLPFLFAYLVTLFLLKRIRSHVLRFSTRANSLKYAFVSVANHLEHKSGQVMEVLFPQVAGGFTFLPYAATLCGTQRTENRRFKIAFRLLPLIRQIVAYFLQFMSQYDILKNCTLD